MDDPGFAEQQVAGPSAAEIRAFAYLLLGRREYSAWELENRLIKKWPEVNSAGELVQDLCSEGLVSDERYAEAFLRSRVQRHQGPMKIRAGLRGKRVSDTIISDTLETMSGQWTELASDWLRRKNVHDITYEERPKHYRRLMNRGFTHEQAMNAVNTV